jgi:protein phosphatase 2C family protein 2/3
MQGWRLTMEDSHTHILALPDDPSAVFFGVYDIFLHIVITKILEYEENIISEALQQGSMDMDTTMAKDEMLKDDNSGTTDVVIVVKDKVIYCANVGDSRAITSVSSIVQSLSYDPKPNNKLETRRIAAAGGWVTSNRIKSNLALSRS